VEASKAVTIRRRAKSYFFQKYCQGKGLDIGASSSRPENRWWKPLKLDCEAWEEAGGIHAESTRPELTGDATYMEGIPDETYDWVQASHLLEHIPDAEVALKNWMRILKPGGFLIICVPHADYYERKGIKPSLHNKHHVHFFHPFQDREDVRSLFTLLANTVGQQNIIYMNECTEGCDDYTVSGIHPMVYNCEYSIEAVIRKGGGRPFEYQRPVQFEKF